MFMKKITLGKSYGMYNSAPNNEVIQVALMEQPPNIKLLHLHLQHSSLHYFPLFSAHLNAGSDNHMMTFFSSKRNGLVTISQRGLSSKQQQQVQSGKPRQMSFPPVHSSSHSPRTGNRILLLRLGIPKCHLFKTWFFYHVILFCFTTTPILPYLNLASGISHIVRNPNFRHNNIYRSSNIQTYESSDLIFKYRQQTSSVRHKKMTCTK